MTVAVALDVYPAKVVFPSGAELTKVRVLIADGRLLMYVTQDGSPHLYYEKQAQQIEGKNALAGMKITVDDGVVSVRKAGGCGCGDRLKTFNPFPGQVRARAVL